MRTTIRNAMSSASALILLIGLLSACDRSDPVLATSHTTTVNAPKVTRVVDGYGLLPGYQGALDYSGNDAIFTVRVLQLEPARASRPISESGDTYDYTPITGTVTEVLKAGTSGVKLEDEITLRVLGGETEHRVTLDNVGSGPTAYHAGLVVQVFTQAPFDSEDGTIQFVPNWAFGVRDSTLYNLDDPLTTIAVSDSHRLADQVARKHGWLTTSD